jgi:hypothetical protein
MGELIQSFVTLSCDGPGCDKTVTFLQTQEEAQKAFQENVWLNSARTVLTIDQRKLTFCSDSCEAKSVATGVHNKQVLEVPKGNNAVELAAQAAARAKQGVDAIRKGAPITIS